MFDGKVGQEEIEEFVQVNGVMGLHLVLYDGGLVLGSRGKELIEGTPGLRSVLELMVKMRVMSGEYNEKTLKRMYNMD